MQKASAKKRGAKAAIPPLTGGQKAPFPRPFPPMLATLTDKPFTDKDWLYEVKWDGYRIMAYKEKGKVHLYTRGLKDYTKLYPAVAEAVGRMQVDCVLDGEVIVLNDEGKPDFNKLQNYHGHHPILYYCFDLLHADGHDLTRLTVERRKEILRAMLPDSDVLRLSESFDDGIALFEQMKKLDMEGVVAKLRSSIYEPGKRTKHWLKVPTRIQQEFVIGGWTESDEPRSFRSLIFGYYDHGDFVYVGHAGGGFKEKEMPGIRKLLEKLEIKKSPFVNEVDTDRPVHYVKPVLVANIQFATWTHTGKIRKPAIFKGFRTDKKPIEVVREMPTDSFHRGPQAERLPVVNKRKDADIYNQSAATAKDSNWPELENQQVTSRETLTFGRQRMEFTNIEKELWRGVTKADLLMYYHEVAPYMLPYLKDRPLSLHVKLHGPMKEGLYIKDMEGRQPAWARVFIDERRHKKKGKRDEIDYLVCNEEATLLWLINLGCIDINPWTSTVHTPDNPDYIVIDLDPSDKDFSKALTTAQAAKQVCDEHHLKAYCKTSGKTGIHISIPCEGLSFMQGRHIAEYICDRVHELVPGVTTTNVSISSRGEKLYIDPGQNDYADTIAAAYSVRPYYYPTVSTPLHWKEIQADLDPLQFDMKHVLKRIKQGDPFLESLSMESRKKNRKPLEVILQRG